MLYILSAIELSYNGYLLWIQNHKKVFIKWTSEDDKNFFPSLLLQKHIIHLSLSFFVPCFLLYPLSLLTIYFFSIVLSQSMFLFLTYLANTVDINDLFPWNVYLALIGIPFCSFSCFWKNQSKLKLDHFFPRKKKISTKSGFEERKFQTN